MQAPARPLFPVSIVAVVLFQVTALFARSMLDARLRRNGMDPDVASDLSYLVVPPILLVLMFPYLRRCREALAELFAPHRLTFRLVACAIALGLTLRALWWSSTTFLIGLGVIRNDDPNAIAGPIVGWQCPPASELAFSMLVMVGLIPFLEEVMYRGFILHALLPRGILLAVAVSSAIFGLTHTSPYVAPGVVGAFIAVQAITHRALWGPVFTHATFNGVAVLDWDCFRIIWNPGVSSAARSDMIFVSGAATVIAVGAATFLVSKKAVGASGPPQPA